jgi:DNA-binding transcriptional MerR regulator
MALAHRELLTIQQASTLTGLTVHTLRYYERIELLAPVGRATNGHRRYDQQDIERINFLNKMRKTGMPLEQIKLFSAVMQKGDAGIPDRVKLLTVHRVNVLKQIEELTDMLNVIDFKIELYEGKCNEKTHTG